MRKTKRLAACSFQIRQREATGSALIAVGNGKVLDSGAIQPLSVKAGDKVLIGKYSGSEVKLDGKDHIILREDDILGIIEK